MDIEKDPHSATAHPAVEYGSWLSIHTLFSFHSIISLTILLFPSHIQACQEERTYSSYSSPRLAG